MTVKSTDRFQKVRVPKPFIMRATRVKNVKDIDNAISFFTKYNDVKDENGRHDMEHGFYLLAFYAFEEGLFDKFDDSIKEHILKKAATFCARYLRHNKKGIAFTLEDCDKNKRVPNCVSMLVAKIFRSVYGADGKQVDSSAEIRAHDYVSIICNNMIFHEQTRERRK